jgi:hypothetical protein
VKVVKLASGHWFNIVADDNGVSERGKQRIQRAIRFTSPSDEVEIELTDTDAELVEDQHAG